MLASFFPRVPLFGHSSEQLLGHKDGQRESLTLLDAKELLKYFTPEGLPVGDLQPLHVPKRYEQQDKPTEDHTQC